MNIPLKRRRLMKAPRLGMGLIIFVSLLASVGILISHPQQGNAASLSNWNPGRIIDNTVFTNANSMNVGQIQSFLNSKVPTCDTNGTQRATDFGRPDLTHAQYAAQQIAAAQAAGRSTNWTNPPYTCLKDFSENGLSAAQIIYNVAQQYQINPQVLLVTLQKEQSVVTDTWPLPVEYQKATNYGCPDDAPCDAQYYGFTNQITWAAKLYHAVVTNSTTWYSPYVVGSNYILWNTANTGCGGSTVTIVNTATAALYDFTPYQPNQAALNAGYGTGDGCSAYGNRNFYEYFTDWFGTTYGDQYQWTQQQVNFYADAGKTTPVDPSHFQPNQRVYVDVIANNVGWGTWSNSGANPARLGTADPQERTSGLCDPTWISCQRPAQLTQSSVTTGNSGTFDFWMNASAIPGSHTEDFAPLAEGQTWMKGSSLVLNYSVDDDYQWQVVSNHTYADSDKAIEVSPTALTTETRVYDVLTVKNTSSITWNNTDSQPLRLAPMGQSNFCDSTWINCSRIVRAQETSVPPGGTATFSYWMTTPNQAGTFTDNLGLLIENVTWLDNINATFSATTTPSTYTWQPVSQQTYTTGNTLITSHFRPSTNYKIVVTAKNTGNTYWRKGIVNIATTSPRDRNSALYNTTWLSNSRVATLDQNYVAPGATGTFTMNVTTPPQQATIHEEFDLIAEGITWMPEQGFMINMNVAGSDYLWQYVGQYNYTDATGATAANMSNLKPSTGYFFVIKARNVGSEVWNKNTVILGTARPDNRSSVLQNGTWLSAIRPATMFETTVNPGDIGTFGFWVVTPPTPGNYSEGFEALVENVTWFNELGINFVFTVKP